MQESKCWKELTEEEKIDVYNVFKEENMLHLFDEYKSLSTLDLEKRYKKNVLQLFLLENNISIDNINFIEIENEYYIDINLLYKLDGYKELFYTMLILGLNNYVLIIKDKLYISSIVIHMIKNKGGIRDLIIDLNIVKSKKKSSKQKTYLMIDSKGYVKIGKSVKPSIREKTLQSENPSITLFAICDENIESLLHNKYKEKRIRGEWFIMSNNEVLDLINEYHFKTIKK